MKMLSLGLLVTSLGCATAQPSVISEQQRNGILDVIRDAEAAGAAEGPPLAVQCLADAKSDLEYAQRIPKNPERARLLVAQARAEAEKALELARADARARLDAREAARHEVLAGASAP